MLVRHGEAIKNVNKEHGGAGTSLTTQGINEARSLKNTLNSMELTSPIYRVINKPQCIQTNNFIRETENTTPNEIISFPTFNLGIADGLSEEALRENHPYEHQILQRWRSGEIEAHELSAITGATNAKDYFRIGEEFLCDIKESLKYHDIILIATRSVLVVLSNILLGNTPQPGGKYKEITWPNTAYATFSFDSHGIFKSISKNTNVRYSS